MLKVQYDAIHDGTEKSEDKTSYTYYNVNYAKPARQWLLDIMTSNTFTLESATSDTAVAGTTTRGVVRNGNNGATSVIGNPIVNTPALGTQSTTGGFRGGRN